jgi:tetratricopeptide (TPR) repeat protein
MNKIYGLFAIILITFSSIFAQKSPLEVLLKLPDDTLKIDTISKYGVSIEFDKMSESLHAQQEALKIAQKLVDKKRVGLMLYKISCEENLLAKAPQALEHLQQAYQIFLAMKMERKLIQSVHKMAQVFEDKKDLSSAMKYYEKSLILANQYKNEEYQAHVLSSMAAIQGYELKQYNLSLQNFSKAISLYQKLGFFDYQFQK